MHIDYENLYISDPIYNTFDSLSLQGIYYAQVLSSL